MLKSMLFLLCLALTVPVLAQNHAPNRAQCAFYKPMGKKGGGGSPDATASCPACDKDRADKKEIERQRSLAEQKARQAELDKLVAERQAEGKAREAEEARRNAVALAELHDLNAQSAQHDRLRREEAARKKAINEKFDAQLAQSNRDYDQHLSLVQAAAGQTVAPSADAFWHETVAPANYLRFRAPDAYKWGYKNKQGQVKMEPDFDYASNFSGGIAYVVKDGEARVINSKGETLTVLQEDQVKGQLAAAGHALRYMNRPDTVSEGLLVMSFVLENPSVVTRYGCLDKDGKLVIPPTFYKIAGFRNGLAKASTFLDEEKKEWSNSSHNFGYTFTYLETGLIDKTGKWATALKKKMVYSYRSSTVGGLEVADRNDKRTAAEKEADRAKVELKEKQAYEQEMQQIEAEVNRRIAEAKSQGYLIEKAN